MTPPKPLLLLVHGVNSTLEWAVPATAVLGAHFNCRPVRYRFFHTIWGPLKVYVSPPAVLFLILFGALALLLYWSPAFWDPTANLLTPDAGWGKLILAAVLLLMALETAIVVHGEAQWIGAVNRDQAVAAAMLTGDAPPPVEPVHWQPPLLFGLVGILGAIFAPHPYQWSLPIAAIVAVAFFLDLREYAANPLSLIFLVVAPMILATIAGAMTSILFNSANSSWRLWYVAAVMAIVGTVCFLEPFYRVNLAFNKVQRRLIEAHKNAVKPIIVAHSLGTYLTANILRETQHLDLGRIVFTGCVLERRFPWEDCIRPNNRGYLAVTNYTGNRDYVPMLTGLVRFLWCLPTFWMRLFSPIMRVVVALRDFFSWRPLGGAGVRGFKGDPRLIHSLKIEEPCENCNGHELPHVIHNAKNPYFDHSAMNQSPSFQQWHWLPTLWGMPFHEYDDWLAICRLGAEAGALIPAEPGASTSFALNNPDVFRACENRLMNTEWAWASDPRMLRPAPRPFRELVQSIVDDMDPDDRPTNFDELLDRLPLFLFNSVNDSWNESNKSQDQDVDLLQRLHPRRALRHAVFLACDV